MAWIEYYLTFPYQTDTESVMFLLHENGFINSWEDRPVEILEIPDGYDYAIKQSDIVIVTYKECSSDRLQESANTVVDQLHTDLKLFKPISIEWKEAEGVSGEEWKEHFQAQAVSDELAIIPVWERESLESFPQKYKMLIEPGGAFGTGNHGTTQSCLRMIEQVKVEGKSVIDIGAGSGILSVYCKMRGAREVFAVDINPSAPSEIHYLCELNGLKPIEVVVTDGDNLNRRGYYDLLLINIGGEEAIRQADNCAASLKTDGQAIVSGIVKWAEADVLKEYERLGFVQKDRKEDDEWITLLFDRN